MKGDEGSTRDRGNRETEDLEENSPYIVTL